ncbi:MAG: hypothetical protein WA139_04500 [Candidatus Aenigmatarchaeota archaeon]
MELAIYGNTSYQTLHNTLKPLENEGRIRFNKNGDARGKRIEIVDEKYFTDIVAGKNKIVGLNNIGFGDHGSELLENPFIKGYLSGILGNSNGSDHEEISKEAIKIMNVFNSCTDKFTDEKISNNSGVELIRVRHHLTILKEKGIFYYDTEKAENGWITHNWYFKGPKNLKRLYVSDTEERIKALEEKASETGTKPKYVCEMRKEDNPGVFEKGHPVILAFDSNLAEENGYVCPECKEPLVLKEGDELAAPLKAEIKLLNESLEEVKKIVLNGSGKEAKQTALA